MREKIKCGAEQTAIQRCGQSDTLSDAQTANLQAADREIRLSALAGEKQKITENTPSKSEYFSWINNTNEGSTEAQTLANLAFFADLQREYGMRLDIYAWDAGNLDGAGNGYGDPDGEKLRRQYPHGYASVAEYAKKYGTRMGIWGGADGYGDTESEAEKRREILISLCRDHRFALFKFDTVCGTLRAEKREEFAKTMRECRKYSPDLILLNHRNDLKEYQSYATTFLWEGLETYTDVHCYNTRTAPHNRAYIFHRGHTPELKRLTEDHGVCISSSVDYFEDDLIYQAFNRCLILSPQIYGNPWLLRDDEYAVLARVFNLHRKYKEILTQAMLPPVDLGDDAVIRGDTRRRFLATGNGKWEEKEIFIPLNESIGLGRCETVCVIRRFPTEKFLGKFAYGDTLKATLAPFRATLIEICDERTCGEVLSGAEYEVLHEDENGRADRFNLLCVCDGGERGEVCLERPAEGTTTRLPVSVEKLADMRERAPKKMGRLLPADVPAESEYLYEKACFSADNESLERRSLRRSGETQKETVRQAREFFFLQDSYRLRGLDSSIAFDGNPHTCFDVKSRSYINHNDRTGFRVEGGCLRVDFGAAYEADKIEIEYFDADEKNAMFFEQTPRDGEVSADLCVWETAPLRTIESAGREINEFLYFYSDTPGKAEGVRRRAVYPLSGVKQKTRYFRTPCPVDRIYTVKAFRKGAKLVFASPRLTNLFAPYEKKRTKYYAEGTFVLPPLPQYPFLAAAFEGKTGEENVFCVAEVDGTDYGFPRRAPAYPSNAYEYPVHPVEGFYTFFMPLKKEWEGKAITIKALFAGEQVPVDVYVCDGHGTRNGTVITLG